MLHATMSVELELGCRILFVLLDQKLSSFCDDSSTSLLLGYIFVQKEKRYVSLFESEIGRKGTIKESRREDHGKKRQDRTSQKSVGKNL